MYYVCYTHNMNWALYDKKGRNITAYEGIWGDVNTIQAFYDLPWTYLVLPKSTLVEKLWNVK